MTYGNFKYLVKALMIGDNTLTQDNNEVLVLLQYAYDKVANESDALKLFTAVSVDKGIIRQGPGNLFVRMPLLPENDSDELDVDDELCFAAARFVCSFISRDKGGIHVNEAHHLIRMYNNKVQAFFENFDQDGNLVDFDDEDQFGKRMFP